jgi:hypothetical protein
MLNADMRRSSVELAKSDSIRALSHCFTWIIEKFTGHFPNIVGRHCSKKTRGYKMHKVVLREQDLVIPVRALARTRNPDGLAARTAALDSGFAQERAPE